jgi:hypothetical protein
MARRNGSGSAPAAQNAKTSKSSKRAHQDLRGQHLMAIPFLVVLCFINRGEYSENQPSAISRQPSAINLSHKPSVLKETNIWV